MTGILTCEARRGHWDAIRGTYMECLPNPFFFKGTPGTPASLDGDVLTVDAPDTYEGLPQKIWAMYAFLLENLEFDYFLRLDDDSVPFVSRFYALLFSIYADGPADARPDYIGGNPNEVGPRVEPSRSHHIGKVSDPALNVAYEGKFENEYLSGGMGLLLSRRAIQAIVDHGYDQFHDPREIYEDKIHGDVLASVGIEPVWAGDALVTTDVEPNAIPLAHHLQNGAGCGAPEFSPVWRGAILSDAEQVVAAAHIEPDNCGRDTDEISKLLEAPRRMFVAWTGDSPLTPKRSDSLSLMEETVGVPIVLVTPENLPEFLVDGFPLHQGYQFLSETHRADYLRCYLMHHHGGAYADIKPWPRSWANWIDALNRSDSLVAGYPAEASHWTANQELKPHWRHLIGNGGFIFRPGTELTEEWYQAEQRAMDHWLENGLAENPATFPQDCDKTPSGYPVPWAALGGAVMDPIIYRFRNRVLRLIQYESFAPESYR